MHRHSDRSDYIWFWDERKINIFLGIRFVPHTRAIPRTHIFVITYIERIEQIQKKRLLRKKAIVSKSIVTVNEARIEPEMNRGRSERKRDEQTATWIQWRGNHRYIPCWVTICRLQLIAAVKYLCVGNGNMCVCRTKTETNLLLGFIFGALSFVYYFISFSPFSHSSHCPRNARRTKCVSRPIQFQCCKRKIWMHFFHHFFSDETFHFWYSLPHVRAFSTIFFFFFSVFLTQCTEFAPQFKKIKFCWAWELRVATLNCVQSRCRSPFVEQHVIEPVGTTQCTERFEMKVITSFYGNRTNE